MVNGQEKPQKPYRHMGIKIDAQVYEKLRYIAQGEGRSLSGQVLYLLWRQVQAYEQKYGQIEWESQSGEGGAARR